MPDCPFHNTTETSPENDVEAKVITSAEELSGVKGVISALPSIEWNGLTFSLVYKVRQTETLTPGCLGQLLNLLNRNNTVEKKVSRGTYSTFIPKKIELPESMTQKQVEIIHFLLDINPSLIWHIDNQKQLPFNQIINSLPSRELDRGTFLLGGYIKFLAGEDASIIDCIRTLDEKETHIIKEARNNYRLLRSKALSTVRIQILDQRGASNFEQEAKTILTEINIHDKHPRYSILKESLESELRSGYSSALSIPSDAWRNHIDKADSNSIYAPVEIGTSTIASSISPGKCIFFTQYTYITIPNFLADVLHKHNIEVVEA
ncbi:MAG: hypothetical protein Q9M91_02075 [Candidatus Dojkabacteria bacterium]|nr:hypothetical protein [Candidatus Dojkabacteria bacterium]MDQ7020611.1 hypothetical protein [Candidatus Dojkabacteria bacterium]